MSKFYEGLILSIISIPSTPPTYLCLTTSSSGLTAKSDGVGWFLVILQFEPLSPTRLVTLAYPHHTDYWISLECLSLQHYYHLNHHYDHTVPYFWTFVNPYTVSHCFYYIIKDSISLEYRIIIPSDSQFVKSQTQKTSEKNSEVFIAFQFGSLKSSKLRTASKHSMII